MTLGVTGLNATAETVGAVGVTGAEGAIISPTIGSFTVGAVGIVTSNGVIIGVDMVPGELAVIVPILMGFTVGIEIEGVVIPPYVPTDISGRFFTSGGETFIVSGVTSATSIFPITRLTSSFSIFFNVIFTPIFISFPCCLGK